MRNEIFASCRGVGLPGRREPGDREQTKTTLGGKTVLIGHRQQKAGDRTQPNADAVECPDTAVKLRAPSPRTGRKCQQT